MYLQENENKKKPASLLTCPSASHLIIKKGKEFQSYNFDKIKAEKKSLALKFVIIDKIAKKKKGFRGKISLSKSHEKRHFTVQYMVVRVNKKIHHKA